MRQEPKIDLEFQEFAAAEQKLTFFTLHSDWDAMRNAIATGEQLNQVYERMTPLLWAIYRGDIEAVKILLEAGADPNFNPTPQDSSHTPLWHAEDDFGFPEIAALLRSREARK